MESQVLQSEKQSSHGMDTRRVSDPTGAYGWHRRYAIPLAYPAAFRFFVDHLMIPHSLGEMLWATASRGWPQLGQKALNVQRSVNGGTTWPCSRKGSDGPAVLQVQTLALECEHHLRRAGLGTDGPLALLTLDDHDNFKRGRTVAFLFDASSSTPCAIAKFTANPRQRVVLQREHQTLAGHERSFASGAPVRIPRPLALFEVPPWTVLLESCLPGRTAYFELRNSWDAFQLSSKHFRSALEWLVAFQQAAGIHETQLDDSVLAEEVVEPLEDFARLNALSAEERALIDNTVQLARRLHGARLIRVARHGDFWAGNVIFQRDRAGVTDWECFIPGDLPFDDLFYFPTTYGLNYPWKLARWAAPEAAFRATYLQATDIARLARTFVLNYCRRVGLQVEFLEVFFPVFLASRALKSTPLESTEVGAGSRDAGGWRTRVRRVRRGAHDGNSGMWRRLFRLYAERDEPSIFVSGAERDRGWA